MEPLCRRVVIFFTFILFAVGIALVITALVTENWVTAVPHKFALNETSVSGGNMGGKNRDAGFVHSGLFVGRRQIDWGLGSRSEKFYVREELGDCNEESCASFMTFGLWICIVLFAVLAILWGAVGVIFALINTVIRPIETICGPLGLYLWSSLAVFCSLVSVVLFVVQFFTKISQNVLLDIHVKAGFSSLDRAHFGFSFWLMVGSIGAFALNIILLLLSGLEMKTRYGKRDKTMPHITDGGVLMY